MQKQRYLYLFLLMDHLSLAAADKKLFSEINHVKLKFLLSLMRSKRPTTKTKLFSFRFFYLPYIKSLDMMTLNSFLLHKKVYSR